MPINANKRVDQILSKKRIEKHKKYIKVLERLSIENNLPENLMVGIYLIETYFRPWHFRIGENLFVVFKVFLNLVFKIPIKNYTIGSFQIGLTTILKFYGKNAYRHSRYIEHLNINDAIGILKAMYYKNNFEIAVNLVKDFYKRSRKTANNYKAEIRHLGEEFNGRYSYGLLLEEIVCVLDTAQRRVSCQQ